MATKAAEILTAADNMTIRSSTIRKAYSRQAAQTFLLLITLQPRVSIRLRLGLVLRLKRCDDDSSAPKRLLLRPARQISRPPYDISAKNRSNLHA